jgi:hypothetical protein
METFGKKSKKELLEKNANIHIPPEVKQDNDVDEDYEYARKMYRSLLKTGTDSLENLADLANDSEHPRAFEVLSTSIKNLSDVADKLMNLQKSVKEVKKKESTQNNPLGVSGPTTNNIFFGTTTELQKTIAKQMLGNEKTINAE